MRGGLPLALQLTDNRMRMKMVGRIPVEDDPKQLAEAQNLWAAFTYGTKISIIAVIAVLLALLVFFVPAGA